ncbi:hypothetical protein [Pseudobacteriovorax antillogorgiicola]|uniref:Uncharacterized protein n=1 Tax=Pseudobacteriovorax antillogorgiicola TaxID=1513793 RepID=A0A1Y6CW15_9BACT|nr:hypothetical protein [Pseudobacteriovorax antillogorgiicola]TCS43494.1 hypothetical protein EDD56_13622 [Pseudobacteriovorax antillogorgiicola]SMF81185.1 hypothetical protein SAMN06296036_13624 [Pseudobacteriovorax antillogorgiicola]
MRCSKCTNDRFELFPAERQSFLWRGSFHVEIMVPLTLSRCESCHTLQRSRREIPLIERAIERSVPLYFHSMLQKLERWGLTRDAISRRSKLGKKTLNQYFDNRHQSPEPEDYRRVLRLVKAMERHGKGWGS